MSGIYEVGEYFRRLNSTLVQHHKSVSEDPPREVRLLQAMKAFMPAERHHKVDSIVDAILLAGTMDSIREERRLTRSGINSGAHSVFSRNENTDGSVHPDGVYDIDANCVAGRNETNGFMLMAMAAMAQK
jgi:hypothetical protein